MKPKRVVTAALLSLCAALPSPVDAAHLGDPGLFLERVVLDMGRDDYAHAWLSLYPPHQHVAPLDEYVACELKSPLPHIEAIVPLRPVRTSFFVAGQAHKVRGAAVTLRIRFSDAATGASLELRTTLHAVPLAGRWRWILPPDKYDLYLDDDC
jgi:hypothetical protein